MPIRGSAQGMWQALAPPGAARGAPQCCRLDLHFLDDRRAPPTPRVARAAVAGSSAGPFQFSGRAVPGNDYPGWPAAVLGCAAAKSCGDARSGCRRRRSPSSRSLRGWRPHPWPICRAGGPGSRLCGVRSNWLGSSRSRFEPDRPEKTREQRRLCRRASSWWRLEPLIQQTIDQPRLQRSSASESQGASWQ